MTASVLDRALGLAADRLDGVDEMARARAELLAQCPTPADLAARFDPTYVRTEAGDLISRRIAEAMVGYDGRLVVSQPPQTGKALDVDTPILTTTGWSTMGALQVGDEVFHPDGHPTPVAEAHPVRLDRSCYRVTTVDGRTVIADGEHLWTVRDRGRRQRDTAAPWETLTTEQIVARGVLAESGVRTNGAPHRAYRFMLPRQHEIVSKPVDLPIDPYVLGAWLGDGDTSSAMFTSADSEITDQIRAAGYTVTKLPAKYRWSITNHDARENAKAEVLRLAEGGMALREAYRRVGLPIGSNIAFSGRTKGQQSAVPIDESKWSPRIKPFRAELRDVGVLGNKHVPDVYLTAGVEQRLALLQGLLDTDGTVTSNKVSSRVVLCVCNHRLALDALYLARSLGWRATIREGVAKLNGRVIGPKWSVSFTAEQGQHVPFRLRRKVDLIQAPQSRGGELHAVSIASIEPVESRPVRCITVEREDGQFLAGRDLIATHNSLTLRWACVWLLLRDPDTRIVYASYAASLARTGGRIVRALVETYGAPYGLLLDRSHADAADWQIEGHLGGVYSVGTGGSLTGRACSAMIIDDPHRSQADADSQTMRDNVREWWSAVARTRLAPGAPVVGVATRWHEQDLISTFIGEGWPAVNIPAQADGNTPDALDREPGTYLITPRNTMPADWATTRREAGERTWAALYQGRPAPLEGGVFKSAWFDTWRLDALPEGCDPPTVVVDPADNDGDGDEAGMLLVATHRASGKVYILDDLSAAMTVARWARVALLTCVRRGAPTLAYERSLSQLPARIRNAWADLLEQATALAEQQGRLDDALAHIVGPNASPERRELTRQQLAELTVEDVAAILAHPSGPAIKPLDAKGSKQDRMLWSAPMFETGRAVLVGRHPKLEHQACFPAGTLVTTRRGDVPIEQVVAGDLAWTRAGWRNVLWSGQTAIEGCAEVRTSSGATLRATPDHRVWVERHGWMSINALRVGHRMLECRPPAPAPRSRSKGSPTASTTTATTRPARPEVARCGCSTATSGPRPTGPSQTAGSSTTLTMTAATTTSRTSPLSPSLCTTATTLPTEASASGRLHSEVPRVELTGPSSHLPSGSASTVDAATYRLGNGPSTAHRSAASTSTASGFASWSAPATAQPSAALATTVLAVDLRPGPAEAVYDLTIEGEHEFFANGLLVHNCTWQPGQDSPDRVDTLVHACSLASAGQSRMRWLG